MKRIESEGDSYAKCPFYLRDRPREIHCEGMTDGAEVRLHFSNGKAKRDYMETECYRLPRQNHCKYCRMLMQQYG